MMPQEEKLIMTGVTALLILSGLMAIVFVKYVNKVLNKVDNVPDMRPLIDKLDVLVGRVEKIFTSLEVTKETTKLEINVIKDHINKLEKRISNLEGK